MGTGKLLVYFQTWEKPMRTCDMWEHMMVQVDPKELGYCWLSKSYYE